MTLTKTIKKIYIGYLPLLTGILFIFLLLTNPINSATLVNTGLTTWYKHMIPSLFPFMVLSGILLRSDLSKQISGIFYPLLGRLFRLSPDCIYIIIMGFLCGFPMGASIIADSLTLHKITTKEADLLLSFCNNIGPIYFISFVTSLCPYYPLYITLPIMYGVPLCYGLLLRYTKFKDIPHTYSKTKNSSKVPANYLVICEESIYKALISITLLGGYMVIFNVIQLPFYNSFYKIEDSTLCILKGIIEINSGITAISLFPSLFTVVYALFLPFGGLCCIFQTYSMIKDTPLSLRPYLTHKLIQTVGTICIYFLGIVICRWV